VRTVKTIYQKIQDEIIDVDNLETCGIKAGTHVNCLLAPSRPQLDELQFENGIDWKKICGQILDQERIQYLETIERIARFLSFELSQMKDVDHPQWNVIPTPEPIASWKKVFQALQQAEPTLNDFLTSLAQQDQLITSDIKQLKSLIEDLENQLKLTNK